MSECIATTVLASLISALIGVVIGAFIGHWFAVNRNKRKEINEVLDRLRGPFESQADDPQPLREVLTGDIRLLRHHLSLRQQKKYDNRIDNYMAASSESNLTSDELRMNQAVYKNPEVVAQAAREILPLLKRR